MRFIEKRESPVSGYSLSILLVFAVAVAAASYLNEVIFLAPPNPLVLVAAVILLDLLCRFQPESRVAKTLMMMAFGILFLVTVCIYGALSTYVTQRFNFPLQDAMFVAVDRALGIEWMSLVLWADRHQTINAILHFAYGTIRYQLAAPVVVFSLLCRVEDLRIYLLGVSIALLLTIVIATLLPAASHLASVDITIFQTLRFSGATPVEHLELLRSDDPAIIPGNLGGLLGFPSFHAAVAVMVPWAMKNVRWVFPLAFVANGAMFASTITEGAHYACDAFAGAVVAVSAIAIARRLLKKRFLDKGSAQATAYGALDAKTA